MPCDARTDFTAECREIPDGVRSPANSPRPCPSGPQDLGHRPTLRKLVDKLVEPANLLHQRVLDVLDAHAADDTGDEVSIGFN
jgi:hypothetical protein